MTTVVNNRQRSGPTQVAQTTTPSAPSPSSSTSSIPVFRTGNGAVFYTPRNPIDRRPRPSALPAFPTPHIRPRQRRPHTIHITSYPPGYIPPELRSLLLAPPSDHSTHHKARRPYRRRQYQKNSSTHSVPRNPSAAAAPTTPTASPSSASHQLSSPTGSHPSTAIQGLSRARLVEKFLAAFVAQTAPHRISSPATNNPLPTLPSPASQATEPSSSQPQLSSSRPVSLLSLGRRLSLSRSRSHGSDGTNPTSNNLNTVNPAHQQSQSGQLGQPRRQSAPGPAAASSAAGPSSTAAMTRSPIMVDAMRPSSISSGQIGHHSNRNSFMSVRSVKSIMTSSVSEITEKPIASGGGLACTILLAEPNVFLTGFEHDGHTQHGSDNGTALLRGKLRLDVTKNVKIRSVTLKLQGKARTEWPEGIPPLKVDMHEEESLRTQALTFFHAMHEAWETPYGNQCTYKLKTSTDSSLASALSKFSNTHSDANSINAGMSARDIKKLSLQQAQSRSFGKGDSPMAHPVQAKGYKVFYPGFYEYTFELPIDHHQLETIKLPFGSVRWDLETTVERAGAFKPNLHGIKEINIVRVPDQLSLETVEPISINRQWEDQLFYDIVISGKSFPIGSKIPIAFKLTPLAKVQLHKLKVYVTESTEYWTNNRRVTRKDAGRKILLFEKTAGKPLDKTYAKSDINVLSGGELSPSERAEARATATRWRSLESRRTHHPPQPLPEPTDNMLGELDLGLESYWGATEIEMNVQIPTCEQMAKNPTLRIHPDCSWKNAHVYHWIKVVMRISRLDADDPEGKRRRHFEISIDSPFTILNCLATQANTSLPQYSGTDAPLARQHSCSSCGCLDDSIPGSPATPITPIDLGLERQSLPMLPQAAHLHTQSSALSTEGDGTGSRRNSTTPPTSDNPTLQHVAHSEREASENPRPIHLMRVPSFDPPAFEDDDSPPVPVDIATAMPTPPPNYDMIVGTPSVDGLADYFSRLANYERPRGIDEDAVSSDDSDSDSDNTPARITSRGGRVNVANPRTPGGRRGPSRSMDIERPAHSFHLSMANVVRRNAE